MNFVQLGPSLSLSLRKICSFLCVERCMTNLYILKGIGIGGGVIHKKSSGKCGAQVFLCCGSFVNQQKKLEVKRLKKKPLPKKLLFASFASKINIFAIFWIFCEFSGFMHHCIVLLHVLNVMEWQLILYHNVSSFCSVFHIIKNKQECRKKNSLHYFDDTDNVIDI